MGLFDKVKGALQGPDYTTVLQDKLGQDRFLAYAPVLPSSTEDIGPQKRTRDLTDVAQKAAGKMLDNFDQNRHIGGAEGSIGRSFSRKPEGLALALADGSISLWRFGMGAKKTNPDLVARIPRENVTSIAATGKRGARGHIRLSFSDDSFFDYQAVSAPSDEFWAAADAW